MTKNKTTLSDLINIIDEKTDQRNINIIRQSIFENNSNTAFWLDFALGWIDFD